MSRRTRGAPIAAVSAAALMLGLAPLSAHADTLADAIALAYASNPTIQAQRASLRALDENWVQARSGFRPSASGQVTASYSETRIPALVGNIESNSGRAVLSLNQPIYTGGRVGAAVAAARGDILSGREALRRVEAQVLGAVIQAYMDVRRDQESLRIQNENVAVLQRQLEESKARFEVGEITRTDVAQSEARLAASVALRQSAQGQLAVSRANFAAVVGQAPGELATPPSLDPLIPETIDGAMDVAEKDNPQIRGAQYAEDAGRARVAGARAERLPSLSLQATLGESGVAQPLHTETYTRNVTGAAVVTIPLFAGGLTNSRVRAAVERNNVDRITVEITRRSVIQSLTQAWSSLIAARANIISTEQQVKSARLAAEGVRQEQQVGLRTTLDVLNAEQELRQAQLSQVNANRDAYVAAATVLNQMGHLTADLIPATSRYDAKANFNKLRMTWGWVPWEEPIAIVDSALTPKAKEKAAVTERTPPK
ncbi:MAG: hypothetical protein CFE28_11435 [Alphaproteobacteria bacterium PA2]|nr:MAG: hypothetical protein CFE28_11435 [Alphaproteobacteria bacterium PA2]